MSAQKQQYHEDYDYLAFCGVCGEETMHTNSSTGNRKTCLECGAEDGAVSTHDNQLHDAKLASEELRAYKEVM